MAENLVLLASNINPKIGQIDNEENGLEKAVKELDLDVNKDGSLNQITSETAYNESPNINCTVTNLHSIMIKFKMEAILVGTNELVNRRKICSAFKSMDMRNAVTTLGQDR